MAFAIIVAVLLGGAAGQHPFGGFYPQRQRDILIHDKGKEVKLIKGDQGLALQITVGRRSPVTALLPQELAQVDVVDFAPGDNIVVIGRASGSVFQVVIVAPNGSTVDRFLCYEPTLSPDKKLLAFRKFYPPHFVEGVSDNYLLYDLTRSPAHNRPPGIPLADTINVGTAMYPVPPTNRIGDNAGLAETQVHSIASDGFFWSSSGERVAFADRYQRETSVVMVEIGDTKLLKSVYAKRLHSDAICKLPPGLVAGQPACWFRVDAIEFLPNGVIQLKLRSQDPAIVIVPILTLQVSDFETLTLDSRQTDRCQVGCDSEPELRVR